MSARSSTAIAPSPHQRAILDALKRGRENLIISAAAGSGKTTTLRLICESLPRGTRTLAVCFNRAIAQEFARKLPRHVEAKTFHGLGLCICRRAAGEVTVEEHKAARIAGEYAAGRLRFASEAEGAAWADALAVLVSKAFATATDPGDLDDLEGLCEEFGIPLALSEVKHVGPIVALCREDRARLSFDDMIDHPLAHDYRFPRYDAVLVDEAQDLNPQQLAFVERLAAHGRLVAVGDRNQAIYAFRGADSRAMDRLRDRFQCREMPLSVSYRCAASIVREAQGVVGADAIQAAPGAPEGEVRRCTRAEYEATVAGMTDGDLVVCRTNAPLVAPCFACIRRGQKAVIRGRDIGAGLAVIVKRHEGKKSVSDFESFVASVRTWRAKRVGRLREQGRKVQAASIDDQVETLLALAENVESTDALYSAIARVFSDDVTGVVFSTIHRAKGLEADRVVYLGPELVPHPMARGDEAEAQERNLDYVARTRARRVLTYQPLTKRKDAPADEA